MHSIARKQGPRRRRQEGGAELNGQVIIVDDVITAGTSVHESIEIISACGAEPGAIVIALDRQETVDGEPLSAIQKIEQQYGVPRTCSPKAEDLIEYLQTDPSFQKPPDIQQYRDAYGLTSETGYSVLHWYSAVRESGGKESGRQGCGGTDFYPPTLGKNIAFLQPAPYTQQPIGNP